MLLIIASNNIINVRIGDLQPKYVEENFFNLDNSELRKK